MKKNKFRYIISVIIILICITVYYFYFQKIYTVKKIFPGLFDTYFEITLIGKNPVKLNNVIDDILEIIKLTEKTANYFDTDSELSKLNFEAQNNFVINVSKPLYDMIEKANYYEAISNRRYSILVGKFKKIYDDVITNKKEPDTNAIEEAIKNFRDGRLILKNKSVKFSNKKISIDLGSIAKGYVIDKVVEYCQAQGIIAGIINAGGDLRVFSKNNFRKWRIGIQHPRDNNNVLDIIELYNGSIATSGDYERYVILKNNKRFHHIINTLSGYPADINISATVIAEKCIDADALSTLFFVLNEFERKEFIQKNKLNIKYIVMDADNNIYKNTDLPR